MDSDLAQKIIEYISSKHPRLKSQVRERKTHIEKEKIKFNIVLLDSVDSSQYLEPKLGQFIG